jgi:hypothetical protein
MAKKQSAGEASAEAAKRRRVQKKPAAAKPPAKKPPAKKPPGKPGKAAAPAKPGKPGKAAAPAQAELPIATEAIAHHPVAAASPDDLGADTTIESTPVSRRAHAAEMASDADDAPGEAGDPPPALSPEEAELSELYSDDLTAPAIVPTEYTDRQTADEDRPMVPEINARDERKAQWQERRDRRRQRRDERDRQRHERRDHAQRAGHDGRPAAPAPAGDARPAHAPRSPAPAAQPSSPALALPPPAAGNHEHDALARVGTPLGDAAATVFAQRRNGQPLPVRQLAQMMRKRNLIESDPEQVWPQLKAELLGDERSYRTLGLRPRIVYRGRDLFAPGPVAMSQTADAEASVAAALSRLAGATHRALAARIARASGAGFERLIHAYLVAAGFREIAWVKRVDGIAYAQAVAPGIDRPVLVSARSGDQPIDRRGIGELRVGVEAKNLVAGILFSARPLSSDAERELERAGRSISVICGDQLVAQLIIAGVGVVSAAAPLHYVDDQLLDELLAG